MSTPGAVRWTIVDLDGLPESGHQYEIVDGELYVTRAPHIDHQHVLGLLYVQLSLWSAESGLGQPYLLPGLIFSETDAVIPDLIWASHLRRQQFVDQAGHFVGAPELVVEVLSTTEKDRKRDRETNLKLYSVQGISEYGIIDRQSPAVEIFRRQESQLVKGATLFADDPLTSPLLPGFRGDLRAIFR